MSNRLDYIGTYLGLGNKISTSGDLWLKILKGSKTAIAEMVRYNKQDVILLEKVYLKLRPYIENHPHVPHENDGKHDCPSCCSKKTQKYGFTFTNKTKIQKRRCMDCGSIFKGEVLNVKKKTIN